MYILFSSLQNEPEEIKIEPNNSSDLETDVYVNKLNAVEDKIDKILPPNITFVKTESQAS